MQNKKRAILGLILLSLFTIISPLCLLNLMGSPVNESTFILMSFLCFLFLVFPTFLFEMMWNLIFDEKKVITSQLREEKDSGVVLKKQEHKNNFKAPLFLAPISLTGFLVAKSFENNKRTYSVTVKTGNHKVDINVKKEIYDSIKENDKVNLLKIRNHQIINFSWFEMVFLGEFSDSISEEFDSYQLV